MKTGTAAAAGLLLGVAGLLMFAGRQVAPAYMGEELMPEAEAAPAEEEEAAPSIWRRIVEGVLPVNFDMQNSNLQAFLAMIRQAEGTAGRDGYNMLFGGTLFDSFADHPRTKITARLGGRSITSTAAGAYQILERTWDEARAALSLPDFSPESQDIAAAWLIRRRGALRDVLEGRIDAAIGRCNREWASLPGSPYGQPVITLEKARRLYSEAGGTTTDRGIYA